MESLFSNVANIILLPAAGAVIGALIKGRLEDSRFFKLQGTRNISGQWKGFLHIPSESKESLIIEFNSGFWNYRSWFNPRLVIGTVFVGKDKDTIECRGGFCSEQYMLLDYRAAKIHVHQFGSMLLRLDSSATELEGDLIGYYDESFIGKIKLVKQI